MSNTMSSAAPQPKKRIAVFLDGTWNTVNDNTNVWRLKALCESKSKTVCNSKHTVALVWVRNLATAPKPLTAIVS